METDYLTLRQLVEAVDIPENTCKRYMLEHERFLDYKKVHNRYMIHVSSVETLLMIRKFYAEGLKRDAVEERLMNSDIPLTITVDEESPDFISYNEELTSMRQESRQALERMEEMMKIMLRKSEEDKQQLLEENRKLAMSVQELKSMSNKWEADRTETLRLSMQKNQDELRQETEERAKKEQKDQEELMVRMEKTVNESVQRAIEEKLVEQPKGFFKRLFSK